MPHYTGAYVDEARGVLMIDDDAALRALQGAVVLQKFLMNCGSLHMLDIALFYKNLERNVGETNRRIFVPPAFRMTALRAPRRIKKNHGYSIRGFSSFGFVMMPANSSASPFSSRDTRPRQWIHTHFPSLSRTRYSKSCVSVALSRISSIDCAKAGRSSSWISMLHMESPPYNNLSRKRKFFHHFRRKTEHIRLHIADIDIIVRTGRKRLVEVLLIVGKIPRHALFPPAHVPSCRCGISACRYIRSSTSVVILVISSMSCGPTSALHSKKLISYGFFPFPDRLPVHSSACCMTLSATVLRSRKTRP